MADDDDTSAGLTPESNPAPRRRASRSAGPPKEAPAPAVTESEGKEALAPAATALRDTGAAATGGEAPEAAAPQASAAAQEQTAHEQTVADVPAVGEDVADEAEPEAARSRRGRLGWVLAGLLVVALVASAVWLLIERNAANDRDAQRNAFVQTARQTVLNLTTIKPDTAKEDVERILAGASGEFRSEFDGREDPFVSVVQEAGVTTVGKILEAGFESQDGNTGKVLVAARADVSTPDGTQNGPRDFRMRVTVTDDGGTMTASKVEFVP
ncbi:hypothetical protein ACWDUM_05085 [Rhodococcus sp. NPDC003322]